MMATCSQQQPNSLYVLTYNNGIGAVPLGVLLALPHAAGAGLCLVGAQSFPLALQTVLVLQVVLHVRLEETNTALADIQNNRPKMGERKHSLSKRYSYFSLFGHLDQSWPQMACC